MPRRPRLAAALLVALAVALPACDRAGSVRDDAPSVAAAAAATTTTATATTEPPTTTSQPSPTTEPPSTTPPTTTSEGRVAAQGAPVAPHAAAWTLEPYQGLGTWVDVYDWSHYKGSTPTVGPDQVDAMAAAGVQTLFIQTAKHDTAEDILEPDLLEPILARARQHGMAIVAWYLPTLEDPGNDLRRLLASARLDVDGIAVDIESRKVGDVGERNRRLVELTAALKQALPGRAVGAIVLPPVLLEVINQNYWPGFPWREIAPFFDVWQTMGYWTDRTWASGHREAYSYTSENQRRLRANLAQPNAVIHPVGGIGDETNSTDLDGFLRAAVEHGAIGGSIYDWRTTSVDAWTSLRRFRADGR